MNCAIIYNSDFAKVAAPHYLKFSDKPTSLSSQKINFNAFVRVNPDCHKNLFGNIARIDYGGLFQKGGDKYFENIAQLDKIKSLPENWDYEGSPPFSATLIDRLYKILQVIPRQPDHISPTLAQSIQLEFHGEGESYMEIEFLDTGEIEAYSLFPASGNEKSQQIKLAEIPETVNNFYEYRF